MPLGRSMIACAGFLLIWSLALSAEAAAQVGGWQWYQDAIWGYRVEYPAYLFALPATVEEQGGITLRSPDGATRLYLFAGPNGSQLDSEGLANELAQIASRVTYRRVAEDWIVLSGYLAASPGGAPGIIFYERIELGVDRSSMAGFRLEYPAVLRQVIDPLIGRIGRSLTTPLQRAPSGGPALSPPEPPTAPSLLAPDDAGSAYPPPLDETLTGVSPHIAWCRTRYRTYNPETDTFKRYDGVQVPCIGPGDDSPASARGAAGEGKIGDPLPVIRCPPGLCNP